MFKMTSARLASFLVALLIALPLLAQAEEASVEPSTKTDPRYAANLAAAAEDGSGEKIFGKLGVAKDWPAEATVGLRGAGGICTGVLVAKDAVLTARHCVCGLSASEVVFGQKMSEPKAVIAVSRAITPNNIGCGQSIRGSDIALLILERDAAARPAAVLASAETAKYTRLRAVGYGLTESGTSGQALYTDIPVVSPTCSGRRSPAVDDSAYYGCVNGVEMVAGIWKSKVDTCNGDSGGPMFQQVGGDYAVAALTSRAISTPGAQTCGDGGVYSLLNAAALKWIRDSGVAVTLASH